MHASFLLRMITDRVTEASVLFRHQSQALEENFEEISYLWPDARGHGYVRGHLIPQVQQFPGVIAALQEAGRLGDAAVHMMERAESAIARVVIASSDFVAPADAALRYANDAEDLAMLASDKGLSRAREARDLSSKISGLGAPPL